MTTDSTIPASIPTLVVGSSPHLHAGASVQGIMRDVLIALVPAAAAALNFFRGEPI